MRSPTWRDAPAAQALAQEGLARFNNDADHSGTVAALAVIALCASAARRYEEAALLLGVTESFSTATGSHILRPHLELIQKLVADAEEAIGAIAFQPGRRRGRHMSIDDAITLALDMPARNWRALARNWHRRGEDRAGECLQTTISRRISSASRNPRPRSQAGLAQLRCAPQGVLHVTGDEGSREMAVIDDLKQLAAEDVVYLTRRVTSPLGAGSSTEVYRGRVRQALSGDWVFNASTGQNGAVGFILGGVGLSWTSTESPAAGIQVTITNVLMMQPPLNETVILTSVIPGDFAD
jgi:hypothetical protein